MEEKEVVEIIDYTEILEEINEQLTTLHEEQAELVASCIDVNTQVMTLNGTALALFSVVVLSFCWSCMRQWRKNVLKMGE